MANSAFLDGLAAGCHVAAGVTAVGAVVAAVFLPVRPKEHSSHAAENAPHGLLLYATADARPMMAVAGHARPALVDLGLTNPTAQRLRIHL